MKIKITKKQEIINDIPQEPYYIVGQVDKNGSYIATLGILRKEEIFELLEQLKDFCEKEK